MVNNLPGVECRIRHARVDDDKKARNRGTTIIIELSAHVLQNKNIMGTRAWRQLISFQQAPLVALATRGAFGFSSHTLDRGLYLSAKPCFPPVPRHLVLHLCVRDADAKNPLPLVEWSSSHDSMTKLAKSGCYLRI